MIERGDNRSMVSMKILELESRIFALEQRKTQATSSRIITPDLDSDQSASGDVASFVAAAALAFGDVCYLNSSSQLALTDADAAATSFTMGMALATIAANTKGTFLLEGFVRNDAWNWTGGGILYLDTTTAGGMTQTAPSGVDDVIIVVGVAYSADIVYFRPSGVIVVHV